MPKYLLQYRVQTDPTRDPVIMKFIREEIAELSLPSSFSLCDYQKKYGERYESLRLKCRSRGGCFDEVIPRFHIVGGDSVRDELYERVGDNLRLKDGVVSFLSSQHRVLQLLAIGGWVRFTEQFTFAPRLYEKIAGLPPERKHGRYRRFLITIQGNHCF